MGKYKKNDVLGFSCEETRLFWKPLSAFNVTFEVREKNDFPFYIPSFFPTDEKLDKENALQHFEKEIRNFLRRYLVAWFKYVEKEKDGIRDISTFMFKVMEYFERISTEKLYKKIVTEQGAGVIDVPANNSVIEIMKFGTSLGIKVSGKSNHKGGIGALWLMAEEDFGVKMTPRFFAESITSSFALRGMSKESTKPTKELTVCFEDVQTRIKRYLPDIVWIRSAADIIISAYKEMKHPGQKIGMLHGVPIFASLTHLYPEGIQQEDYADKNNAIIYRKGNVSKEGSSIIHFDEGYDLALMLSVKNSFSNPTEKIAGVFDNHLEQEKIKNIGTSIHVSLLNMMLNCQLGS